MQAISISLSNPVANVRRADGVVINSACHESGGASFSASELLAAALGSCLAASLAPLLARHGLDAKKLEIVLMGKGASIAEGLVVGIRLPSCTHDLELRCRRAAEACPVKRALNVPLEIHWKVS